MFIMSEYAGEAAGVPADPRSGLEVDRRTAVKMLRDIDDTS
jgi:hypothetical protein